MPLYLNIILLFHVYGSADYVKTRAGNTWLKEFENNHDIVIYVNLVNDPYSSCPRVVYAVKYIIEYYSYMRANYCVSIELPLSVGCT